MDAGFAACVSWAYATVAKKKAPQQEQTRFSLDYLYNVIDGQFIPPSAYATTETQADRRGDLNR